MVAEIVWAALEVQGVIYTLGEEVSYGRLAEIREMVWKRNQESEEWSVEMLKEVLAKE